MVRGERSHKAVSDRLILVTCKPLGLHGLRIIKMNMSIGGWA
jgi:hypothetical protein